MTRDVILFDWFISSSLLWLPTIIAGVWVIVLAEKAKSHLLGRWGVLGIVLHPIFAAAWIWLQQRKWHGIGWPIARVHWADVLGDEFCFVRDLGLSCKAALQAQVSVSKRDACGAFHCHEKNSVPCAHSR